MMSLSIYLSKNFKFSQLVINFLVYTIHASIFFVYNQSANILLPFDNSSNSKRALKKAITLAKLMNCKITIVHVIAYHQTVAKIVGPYKNSLIKYVDEFIEKAKTSAKKSGVITEEKILYGSPSEEILKFTKKRDLIWLF